MYSAPLDMISLYLRGSAKVERKALRIWDGEQIVLRPVMRIGTVTWPWTPTPHTGDMVQMIEDLEAVRNAD